MFCFHLHAVRCVQMNGGVEEVVSRMDDGDRRLVLAFALTLQQVSCLKQGWD